MRANSRTPEVVLGDIRGQVGVARLGERRLADTIARYGRDAVLATFAERQNVGERYVRGVLRQWPDGMHEGERFLDSGEGGGKVRFHVRVHKRGDRIAFDFSASDDQQAGPINIRPPLVRGCIAYAMIATIDPAMPNNGGLARVIEMHAAARLDPRPRVPGGDQHLHADRDRGRRDVHPRARRIRARAADRRQQRRQRALDRRTPARRQHVLAVRADRRGLPARAPVPTGRRASRCCSPTRAPRRSKCSSASSRRASARFELIADSGGAGEYRGGLGARRTEEMLGTTQLTVRSTGHVVAAWARDGGAPGSFARFTINPGTARAEVTGNRFSGRELRAGDVIADERGGGGGLGDPHRRPFEKILDDVLDGYVTRAAAIEIYGVDAARLDAAVADWENACPNH